MIFRNLSEEATCKMPNFEVNESEHSLLIQGLDLKPKAIRLFGVGRGGLITLFFVKRVGKLI